MPSVDELKQARDGHLEYGKVPSSEHSWVKPVQQYSGEDDEFVYYTLGPGTGDLAYRKVKE